MTFIILKISVLVYWKKKIKAMEMHFFGTSTSEFEKQIKIIFWTILVLDFVRNWMFLQQNPKILEVFEWKFKHKRELMHKRSNPSKIEQKLKIKNAYRLESKFWGECLENLVKKLKVSFIQVCWPDKILLSILLIFRVW